MTAKRRAKDKIDTNQPITAKDLQELRDASVPSIRAMIDAAEILAGSRRIATEKGIDWSQFKALLKAEILDGGDDGERVANILKKADTATAYADMLGISRQNNVFAASPHNPVTGEVRANG